MAVQDSANTIIANVYLFTLNYGRSCHPRMRKSHVKFTTLQVGGAVFFFFFSVYRILSLSYRGSNG